MTLAGVAKAKKKRSDKAQATRRRRASTAKDEPATTGRLLEGLERQQRVADLRGFMRVLLAHVTNKPTVDGTPITAADRAAYDRFLATEITPIVLRSVPKRDYIRISGRATKILHEQADRYGLPLRGETIDLIRLLPAFHDLLATHWRKFSEEGGNGDPLLEGPSSPWLEQYREEKTLLARMERKKQERRLVPVEEIEESWGRIIPAINQAGQQLADHFGRDAQEILNDVLELCATEAEKQTAAESTEDETP